MNDGTRRIKNKIELNKLINNKNIINHIRSLRLGWFGHINIMQDQRLVKKYINGNQLLIEDWTDRRKDGKVMY